MAPPQGHRQLRDDIIMNESLMTKLVFSLLLIVAALAVLWQTMTAGDDRS